MEIKAFLDETTGLLNKDAFKEKLQEWSRESNNFTIMYCDLEFLKYYNNQNGREAGNMALKMTGFALAKTRKKLMESGIKSEVFRVGGDEFIILVDSEDPEILSKTTAVMEEQSKKMGAIPMSPAAKENYREEEIHFGIGWATRSQANTLVENIIASPNPPYSETELEDLRKYLENQPLENEINTLNIVNEIQIEASDEVSDRNKAINKLVFLLRRYEEISAVEDKELRDLEISKYAVLVGMSGKSTRGKSVDDFATLFSFAKENNIDVPNLSPEDVDLLTTMFYGENF
jgi:diguanylate cyclase (GGDEF)-like protein